jgi:hypothetical protein
MPAAPGEACTTDPFTDFICFLESDPFEITDFGNTQTFRWGVRVAQHENLEDWVITVAWYNVDGLTAFWWVGTVEGNGKLENLSFCLGDFEQCANLAGACNTLGTTVCGEAVVTDLSRCDFQCPQQFQLTPGGIVNGTCDFCQDDLLQTFAADVVVNPVFQECESDGDCHWAGQFDIEGAPAGCPDLIQYGVSLEPVLVDGTGPPWHVFAFIMVRIDGIFHRVAWRRLNVDQVCCELDIQFRVDEICDISEHNEPIECDFTETTLHLVAGSPPS